MLVVSVINYKGGVGKTTVTANIGAELTRRGYRILLNRPRSTGQPDVFLCPTRLLAKESGVFPDDQELVRFCSGGRSSTISIVADKADRR